MCCCRAERIEIFDEMEEWHLIQQHYCIALGIKDAAGLLTDFGFKTYEAQQAVVPCGD
jgi:tRNA wybutosine-synthesizing protein 4